MPKFMRKEIFSSLVLLAFNLISGIICFIILATSSHNLIAYTVGDKIPAVITGAVIIRNFCLQRWLGVFLSISAGIIGIGSFETLNLSRALAEIYRIQILLTSNYESRCQPPQGVMVAETKLRICNVENWSDGEWAAVVVKAEGDPDILLKHKIADEMRKFPIKMQHEMPLGGGPYEISKITQVYYVMLFYQTGEQP